MLFPIWSLLRCKASSLASSVVSEKGGKCLRCSGPTSHILGGWLRRDLKIQRSLTKPKAKLQDTAHIWWRTFVWFVKLVIGKTNRVAWAPPPMAVVSRDMSLTACFSVRERQHRGPERAQLPGDSGTRRTGCLLLGSLSAAFLRGIHCAATSGARGQHEPAAQRQQMVFLLRCEVTETRAINSCPGGN